MSRWAKAALIVIGVVVLIAVVIFVVGQGLYRA